MLVLPADAWIDPEREAVYREVLGPPPASRATARSASRRRS